MKKLLILFTGLLLALPMHAAVLNLSDFSAFTPTYFGFTGSWSVDTAQSGPTSFTVANFGAGQPKNDGSFTSWLASTQDFSSYSYVNLSGSAFAGNTTTSLGFFVEDADGNSGLATFSTADFASGFSSVSLAGLYSVIDPSHIVNWGFSTENQDGSKNFAFTFDQVSLSTTAIPEPSTYAAMAGGLSLFAAMVARRRRRMGA